jgi:hypothetical protein
MIQFFSEKRLTDRDPNHYIRQRVKGRWAKETPYWREKALLGAIQ